MRCVRLRLAVLTLALGLFALAGAAPAVLSRMIVPHRYIRAAMREYAAQVECSGVLEQLGKREVFLSAPVIAQRVLVAPGDTVEQGDTLALIDTELTRSVLSQSVTVEKKEQRELSGEDLERLEQVAAVYGVSLEGLLPQVDGEEPLLGAERTQQVVVPERVLAPMDGMVTKVDLQDGLLTQADGAVFTIAQPGRYAVRAQLSEAQVGKVAPGDAVELTLTAVEGHVYHGVVTQIAPTAERSDTGQVTIEVLAEVLDADEALRDNYSADMTITSQTSRILLSVPYEAVCQDEDQTEYVWVYEDGYARKTSVSTGEEFANCIEIVSGLSPESLVITEVAGLSSGSRIRLGEEGML